jgi:hypothetical protein
LKPPKEAPSPSRAWSIEKGWVQFFHLKKFLGKVLWNRKLLSKVAVKQIQLINDLSSVYQPKLFHQH